jgi:hypothetical protein
MALSVEFDAEGEACGCALRSWPQVEVLEPQALHRMVIVLAQHILELPDGDPCPSLVSRREPIAPVNRRMPLSPQEGRSHPHQLPPEEVDGWEQDLREEL